MIFHIVTKDQTARHMQTDITVPIEGCWHGISQNGARPQTVTLTKQELITILADENVAINVLIAFSRKD